MESKTVKIKIKSADIFNYVVGNSCYDAIECCIDPTQYEVFDTCIYDNKARISIVQSETYQNYCSQVSKLRNMAKAMGRWEIEQMCKELAEISPTEIML